LSALVFQMVQELGPVSREDDDDSEATDSAEESDGEETDTTDEGEGGEMMQQPSKGKQRVHLDSTDDQLWYRLSLLNVGEKKSNVSEGEDPLLDQRQDALDDFQPAQETVDELTGTSVENDGTVPQPTQAGCDTKGELAQLSEATGGKDSCTKETVDSDVKSDGEDSSEHSGNIRGEAGGATSVTASTIDPRTRRSRIKYEKEKAKQKAKEKRIKRKGKAGMMAKERRGNEDTIRSYTSGSFF
jgi:hypothetical protein